jgi:hypothetical protein
MISGTNGHGDEGSEALGWGTWARSRLGHRGDGTGHMVHSSRRRWGTARKRAGRSPSGLATTHCRAAARHGGKSWKLHPNQAPEQLIASLIPMPSRSSAATPKRIWSAPPLICCCYAAGVRWVAEPSESRDKYSKFLLLEWMEVRGSEPGGRDGATTWGSSTARARRGGAAPPGDGAGAGEWGSQARGRRRGWEKDGGFGREKRKCDFANSLVRHLNRSGGSSTICICTQHRKFYKPRMNWHFVMTHGFMEPRVTDIWVSFHKRVMWTTCLLATNTLLLLFSN